MTESCPGEKFKGKGLVPSSCETINEEWVRKKVLAHILWTKGYLLDEIEEEVPLDLDTGQETFHLKVSLIIRLNGRRLVLIKCGPGSILARERAALALSRIIMEYQIPLTVVTNGEEAALLDTLTGETLVCGADIIPDKNTLLAQMADLKFIPLPGKRLKLEKQILAAFEGLGLQGECR
ncbi:MAG: type I restriction enzyme HsdR N-terminal domain-containing protein [Thermodesulfobacteriota bacterium]